MNPVILDEIKLCLHMRRALFDTQTYMLVFTAKGGLERKYSDEVQGVLDEIDLLIAEKIHSAKQRFNFMISVGV